MTAKCIMLQGTGSSVGKSRLVTGLCRIFSQDGYKVAPFKSQNMALNSYITDEGLEMGRAQAAQAEACGIKPSVLMGPVLLKPGTDKNCEVIVMGKSKGRYSAMDYHNFKPELLATVKKAYDELAGDNDIIVIEGAGSPAEINLRDRDIVNMGMAELVDAPVILVGDIDKGGVFASIAGTMLLLTEGEKVRVKGTVINKFRGDADLLKPGLKMLEDIIKIPTLGVIPYSDVYIDEEDSPLEEMQRLKLKQSNLGDDDFLEVKVLGLSRIVNFTDFVPLGEIADVNLSYVPKGHVIGRADLVIIPGTTNVDEDMGNLKSSGWDNELCAMAKEGKAIFGVGGGYALLGGLIQCEGKSLNGLGLLDVETVFESGAPSQLWFKATSDMPGLSGILAGVDLKGYVLQKVKGVYGDSALPFAKSEEPSRSGQFTGAVSTSGNIIGTDLHGIFDKPDFVSRFVHYIKQIKAKRELEYIPITEKGIDINAYRQREYDRWAKELRDNLDINALYRIMNM